MEVEPTTKPEKTSDPLQTQSCTHSGWVHTVQKAGPGLNRFVARAIQACRISLFLGVLDL